MRTFVNTFLLLLLWLPSVIGSSYFLITFHGGNDKNTVKNILRYRVEDQLLVGPLIKSSDDSFNQLRGVVWDADDKQVLFLNAHKSKNDLEVLQSPTSCSDPGPIVNSTKKNLQHPYNLVIHKSLLYITDQDGDNVIEMRKDLKHARLVAPVVNPRGLTFGSDGLLYVASETVGVVAINVTTNQQVRSFGADKPIDLVAWKDLVIFGSRGKAPAIYAWSITQQKIMFSMNSTDLNHPAGMKTVGDTLYVLSQNTKSLLSFNLTTQTYNGIVIPKLPDYPECLEIVKC